jgi:hypothetical protein
MAKTVGKLVVNTGRQMSVTDNEDETATLDVSTSNFSPPTNADAVTVDYTVDTQEIYSFKKGGISGEVLMTVTINYTDSTKDFIASAFVN